MLEVFFDIQGLVHFEFIPDGQTVGKETNIAILRHLRDAVKRKRHNLWQRQNWVLHHDNAPAHRSLLVSEFLAIPVFPQPSYSPDLAPADLYLLSKAKFVLKCSGLC